MQQINKFRLRYWKKNWEKCFRKNPKRFEPTYLGLLSSSSILDNLLFLLLARGCAQDGGGRSSGGGGGGGRTGLDLLEALGRGLRSNGSRILDWWGTWSESIEQVNQWHENIHQSRGVREMREVGWTSDKLLSANFTHLLVLVLKTKSFM